MSKLTSRLIPLIYRQARQCMKVTSSAPESGHQNVCASPSWRHHQQQESSRRLSSNCNTSDIERALLSHHFYCSLSSVSSSNSCMCSTFNQGKCYHRRVRFGATPLNNEKFARYIHSTPHNSCEPSERGKSPLCPPCPTDGIKSCAIKKCTIQMKTRVRPRVKRREEANSDDELLKCDSGCRFRKQGYTPARRRENKCLKKPLNPPKKCTK